MLNNRFIVDSSVWIDFFNKKGSKNIEKVIELMYASTLEDSIIILPVILQEILQGIRDDKQYELVSVIIHGFKFIDFDPYKYAVKAADLFRALQKKGITIRKANNCVIAAFCIDLNIFLIHNDSVFDNIAKHTSLKIYK